MISDWIFNRKAHIELPISCSIKSSKIRCGALSLTSNKAVIIEVGSPRMREIKKQTTGEDRVRITEETFRGNLSTAASIFNFPKTTLGLSTFYWVLIGAVLGGALVTATIVGICKLFKKGSEPSASKLPSGGTVVHNNIQINPESRFKLGSFKRKKNHSLRMEELPFQPEEVKETEEKIMTLGE